MSTFRKLTLAALVLLATGVGARRLHGDQPRVVPIHARRFEFEPKEVHVARGEAVVLEVTSEDVTHGFFSRPLRFDEDIEAGKTVRVPVTASESGTYTVICDHYCGSGHGNMKMTIVVD